MVGAIHGRLLTAWAVAGVLGPVLVDYLREYQLSIGVEKAAAYDITLYILAGLLVLGFICNALVRPVAPKYFIDRGRAGRRAPPMARSRRRQRASWSGRLIRRASRWPLLPGWWWVFRWPGVCGSPCRRPSCCSR